MARFPSSRPLVGCLLPAALICAAATFGGGVPAAEDPPPDFARDVYPLLDAYCARCHDGEDAEAGVDLLWHRNLAEARQDPALYRRAAWEVWRGAMPPSDRPQPSAAERAVLLRWVDEVLDRAVPPDAPEARLRRLNNGEYRNAVRDLTGVDLPARDLFPADNVGAGFDTIGSALSLSPERFALLLDAAEEVAERAVAFDDPRRPAAVRRGADELVGGRSAGGAAALYSRGAVEARVALPRAGRYRVRVQAWGTQAGDEPCRMRVTAGGERLGDARVPATADDPQIVEYAWTAGTGGAHAISAHFLNDYYRPDDPDPAERDRNLFVDWIEVEGPLEPLEPTAFQEDLFTRFPAALGEKRRAAMLAHLAERAWRRPPGDAEVARLAALAPADAALPHALRLGLEALLVSPHFLYRWDLAPPAEEEAEHAAHALASRLSFFLWSSAPDEELLAAARSGRLLDPEHRAEQVTRMLASPRARALAEDFAAQWLQLRRLDAMDADGALIASMREETLRLFEHVLREERSAWELLTADYSFVDARLAEHYGLPAPADEGFQRASLEDTARRGVLGHASVLTLTSRATRTSPVLRGKWILETVIGNPPPPPPPGADNLEEDGDDGERSLRERLELHRARPECSSCHATMDPLGFGLEGFGPRGRQRTEAGGFPVDARGALPDGRSFAGARELVALLAADDAFLRCLTEKLATYALGRPMEPADRPMLQRILAGLDPERPTVGQIVRGIIASEAFLADAARAAVLRDASFTPPR